MLPRGAWFERAESTKALGFASIAAFLVEVVIARSPWGIVAMPREVLYTAGMSDALAVFRELRLETLVTSCFVHASALHLACNLYALVQIGPPVERALGLPRTAALCLTAGVAGSLTSAVVGWIGQTDRTSLGLSGVVCGLLGGALAFGLRRDGWASVLARSMARWLGLLVAVEVAALCLGVASHVDNAAHAGAALVGAAMGAAWAGGDGASSRERRGGLPTAAALVVAAAFTVVAYRDRRDPFATLGATERCELASILIRSRRCDDGRAALDAATRLLPGEPTVLALEGEWRRSCPSAAVSPRP